MKNKTSFTAKTVAFILVAIMLLGCFTTACQSGIQATGEREPVIVEECEFQGKPAHKITVYGRDDEILVFPGLDREFPMIDKSVRVIFLDAGLQGNSKSQTTKIALKAFIRTEGEDARILIDIPEFTLQ